MRPTRMDEWRRAGAILGAAFADDPVTRWSLGGPVAVRDAFTRLARAVYLPRGISLIDDAGGCTLWLPPGANKDMGVWPQMGLLAALVARSGPGAIRRALELDTVMRQHRPAETHFYLFAVGVLPEARGQGLGRRLIAATLADADAAGLPAYLENSNPRNESLYRGLGFEPTATFAARPGAPPLTGMMRRPG